MEQQSVSAKATESLGKKTGKSGKKVKIGTKLMGIVSMCLVFLMLTAGVGIWQMVKIGDEIKSIANKDLPLTVILTKVTTHQLEQSIRLEQALRFGTSQNSADAEKTATARAEFNTLGKKVDEEIAQAIAIAEKAYKSAATPGEQEIFNDVQVKLSKIAAGHKDFGKKSEQLFTSIDQGNSAQALGMMEGVQKLEKELNRKLETMLIAVENFTLKAAKTADAHEQTAIKMLAIIAVMALVLGLVMSWLFIKKSITQPLSEIVNGLKALGENKTDVHVKVYSNDEIGAVASAFGDFKEVMIRAKEMEQEQKDKEKEAEQIRKQAMYDLADDFEKDVGSIVEKVADAAQSLNGTASTLTEVSNQTSNEAVSVSEASNMASANVNTVAAASEELSASIGEINQQTTSASNLSKQAVDQAKITGAEISNLAEMTEKISSVVELISDIAEQTNLLALNATIEAARAGEAGKGFAVVASEVKALSNQTSNATDQITKHIHAIQTATHSSVSSIDDISAQIIKLNDASVAIAAAMEEQGAVTQEIARNVQQASQGTADVNESINNVTHSSQKAGDAAGLVLASSSNLSDQADHLKEQMDKFISAVRAG